MKIINKYKSTPEEQKAATYIGRGSPFGNRYEIGKHGDRASCVQQYGPFLWNRLISREAAIENAFKALTDDTTLLCFCVPQQCHGETIVWTWETFFKGRDYEEAIILLKHHVEQKEGVKVKEVSTPKPSIDPTEDGISHINVYSKGKTELGRLLSNFAHVPFEHPEHGHFSSVEGFWYWLSTNKHQNDFRGLYGFKAKQVGKLLQEELRKTGQQAHIDGFKQEIKKAIFYKITQNDSLKSLLKSSTLPLTHYYVYGEPPDARLSFPTEYDWIHEYISDIREWLNGRPGLLLIAGSRDYSNYEEFEKYFFESRYKPIMIIQGGAKGTDRLGHLLAKELEIPELVVEAKWDKIDEQGKTYFDKAAGMLRNGIMVGQCDSSFVVWDGKSPGTKNTIQRLQKAKKNIFLVLIKPEGSKQAKVEEIDI